MGRAGKIEREYREMKQRLFLSIFCVFVFFDCFVGNKGQLMMRTSMIYSISIFIAVFH